MAGLICWSGAGSPPSTAFNRYYYAAFLTTRDLLIQIDKGWSRTSHANIPELLEADLLKRVRASVKKLETKGLLAHGRSQSLPPA